MGTSRTTQRRDALSHIWFNDSDREAPMRPNPLRTTQIPAGKVAVWQLVDRAARILRVQLTGQAFTAYRLPSRTPLPGAQPGTILFDTYPDLVDARELLPQHSDLWDAVREDYWAALVNMSDRPASQAGT